jgi:hypothetical protein
MPKLFPRITTRQRAFLEEHGFPLDVVIGDVPLQPDGVSTIDMIKGHPWIAAGGTLSFDGSGTFTYGYPDDRTASSAAAARDGDWAELIGPERVRELDAMRGARPN